MQKNKTLQAIINCFLCIFLIVLCSCSPKQEKEKTDYYLSQAKKYFESDEPLKQLEFARKANVIALKQNNSEQIVWSYYYIANAFSHLGLIKRSLSYVQLALEQDYAKNDSNTRTMLYELKASNYSMIGLYGQARSLCDKTIRAISPLENDTEKAIALSYAYTIKGTAYYQETNSIDSTQKYTRLALKVLEKQPKEKVHKPLSDNLMNEVFNQIEKRQKDSALYYINKARLLKNQYNDKEYSHINDALAQCYYISSDYEKAVEHFLKVVDEVKSSNKVNNGMSNYVSIYQDISECYAKLGNTEKEKQYLEVYIEENKKMNKANQQAIAKALEIMNKENIVKFNFQKYVIIAFSILFIIIIGFSVIKIYKYRKKNKINVQLIEEKEEENQELLQKVNEAFDEVVQLAKENSPEFLTRFREVYPEYYNKLITIEPKLLNTEIKLCAMIYLGFISKDIAEYTCVTLKAAQHRKFRLRKKLNIPSDVDISKWINENY